MFLDFYPMDYKQVFAVLMIGLSALVGQYGITLAYKFAKPAQVSIFDYSSVVFSLILGVIFLHQVPTFLSLVGMAIIFFAFFVIFLYNQRNSS